MANDDMMERIIEITDQVLDLARDSLAVGDVAKFSKLNEVAVTLAELAPSDGETAQVSGLVHTADDTELVAPATQVQPPSFSSSDYNMVSIFAKYNSESYEAELDVSHITSTGSGKCIWFRGQWMTTSGSAGRITGGAVNGWRFWRYQRPDGSEGRIDEIRKSVINRIHSENDSDDESNVPW